MIKSIVLIASLSACVFGIPIDNGVEGEPEIECGPTSIAINFNTANNFEGHVYVKNRFTEDDCRTTDVGRRVTGINLDFSVCGTKRTRSAEPKGVFVETTVIITFHPNFLTKVDRAYTIQCFYMEADKTVSTDIEVSMITTGFQTEFVPMPVCRYEILDGGPTGPIIQFAIIGQSVYHKWTCDTDTTDTFCMTVHTCYVDDGAGDQLDLINEDGCANDKNILDNLDYTADLMVGQESHVFKYADRPQLYFTCQITISVKEPNGQCPVPDCAEAPASFGRKKRNAVNDVALIDVMTSNIEILDITPEQQRLPQYLLNKTPIVLSQTTETLDGVCLSPAGFNTLLIMLLGGGIAALFVTLYTCSRRSAGKA